MEYIDNNLSDGSITTERFINILDENFQNIEDSLSQLDKFKDDIKGYIVEQGIDKPKLSVTGVTTNWTYRIWNNGIVECWAKISKDVDIETKLTEGDFYSSSPQIIQLPSFFTADMVNNINMVSLEVLRGVNGLYLSRIAELGTFEYSGTQYSGIKYYLYRDKLSKNIDFDLYFHVKTQITTSTQQ